MDLLIGIAIGTAFAPFWMMVYTKWIKPQIQKLTGGSEVNVDFTLILGLSLGAGYVHADEDADIAYPCVVIDLLVFRVVIEFTGE